MREHIIYIANLIFPHSLTHTSVPLHLNFQCEIISKTNLIIPDSLILSLTHILGSSVPSHLKHGPACNNEENMHVEVMNRIIAFIPIMSIFHITMPLTLQKTDLNDHAAGVRDLRTEDVEGRYEEEKKVDNCR